MFEDRPVRRLPVAKVPRGDAPRIRVQSRERGQARQQPKKLGALLDIRDPERDPPAVHESPQHRRFRVFSSVPVLLGQNRAMQLFPQQHRGNRQKKRNSGRAPRFLPLERK